MAVVMKVNVVCDTPNCRQSAMFDILYKGRGVTGNSWSSPKTFYAIKKAGWQLNDNGTTAICPACVKSGK